MGILEVFQVTRKDYLRLILDRERGGPLMARPYCCPITPYPFSNIQNPQQLHPRKTLPTTLLDNFHSASAQHSLEESDAIHPVLKLASIRPPP
ncbi:hypothetical protein CH063_04871 [Colletotrichum higginsianum]|uniref:Uncharacterized protein n=1 Tax=Colletotrichum higginsianum (strain IMI 349063) TaxID=759273 RepID=H1UWZ0_COLHI|nr:hypothetical protein CH063_04871 [Colletotrichum higginsianum]